MSPSIHEINGVGVIFCVSQEEADRVLRDHEAADRYREEHALHMKDLITTGDFRSATGALGNAGLACLEAILNDAKEGE